MAFSVAQMYPGAFTPDVNFVDGKYKNSSAPGVYDGTPLDNLLFNQNLALFDALMLEANLTYNNSADIPSTSQIHKAMQIGREVSPRNNDWNGYLDPAHTVPIEYEDTSAGTRSFPVDTEIAPNLYVSAATNVTFSATGISWLAGNSLYKMFDYTTEQFGLIDVNTVPVYLIGQNGVEHFVDNSTTGVTVSKVGGRLKVEVDSSIFVSLDITSLWYFFVTSRVGRVPQLSVDSLIKLVANKKVRDVSLFRVSGVTYTNNTVDDMVASVNTTQTSLAKSIEFIVEGVDTLQARNNDTTSSHKVGGTVLVPPGGNYVVNITGDVEIWTETGV